MSPDSHKIDMPIENTEEAFNFFDEVLVYKTAAVFDYFNNLNCLKFKELLKKLLLLNGNYDLFSCNKALFDRSIFYQNMYSILFRNKAKEDFLKLNLAKVFEVLTENKGVVKFETVIYYLINY